MDVTCSFDKYCCFGYALFCAHLVDVWELKLTLSTLSCHLGNEDLKCALVLNPQQGLPVFPIDWQLFSGLLLKYSLQVSSKCGRLHSQMMLSYHSVAEPEYLIECEFSSKVRFQVGS